MIRTALVKLGAAATTVIAFLIIVNQFVRVSVPGSPESDGIVFRYIQTGQIASFTPWLFGATVVVWLALLALGRWSIRSSGRAAPASGAGPDPILSESTPDSVPEWLSDKAEDAPTMMRVLVETCGSRLRRARPGGLVDRHWHRFREAGTVGGCVALALRLHVDIPKPMRTLVEQAMRASLDLGLPEASEDYEACSAFLRESLLDVERPKRARAVPVLIATWVCAVVGGEAAMRDEPETIAELATLYQSETTGYWVSAGLE